VSVAALTEQENRKLRNQSCINYTRGQGGNQGEKWMNKSWTSLAAFLLILLFASAADGLMDSLGPGRFMAIGLVIMGVAWGLVEVECQA